MKEHTAKHIMTKKVITIGKDATVKELSELLIKNKISGVPVVDDNKKVIGMITEADIIKKESSLPYPLSFGFAFIRDLSSLTKTTEEFLKTPVEEVMTRNVKVVNEDTPLSKIVNIMINNNINRVPVVDKNNRLVGIITRADIIRSMISK
ncbi:MAG: CBS domain-containing protein [Actinobacteria bacterium]|nr:CBS domain-containing protein [Actinomycetota bacterium]